MALLWQTLAISELRSVGLTPRSAVSQAPWTTATCFLGYAGWLHHCIFFFFLSYSSISRNSETSFQHMEAFVQGWIFWWGFRGMGEAWFATMCQKKYWFLSEADWTASTWQKLSPEKKCSLGSAPTSPFVKISACWICLTFVRIQNPEIPGWFVFPYAKAAALWRA